MADEQSTGQDSGQSAPRPSEGEPSTGTQSPPDTGSRPDSGSDGEDSGSADE